MVADNDAIAVPDSMKTVVTVAAGTADFVTEPSVVLCPYTNGHYGPFVSFEGSQKPTEPPTDTCSAR